MENKKIVKLEIVDYDVDYGDNPILDSILLINPDKKKLDELKQMIETRFDYQCDDSLTDEEIEKAEEFAGFAWGAVYDFINNNFEILDVDSVYEIEW